MVEGEGYSSPTPRLRICLPKRTIPGQDLLDNPELRYATSQGTRHSLPPYLLSLSRHLCPVTESKPLLRFLVPRLGHLWTAHGS